MAKHQKQQVTSQSRLERIKSLAIIAMFSDDQFMELLTLKGGNALDIVHRVSMRASIDVDFSMETEFPRDQLEATRVRVERALRETFRLHAFEVFDVTLRERPQTVTLDLASFWGGYLIEFKIVEADRFVQYAGDIVALRKAAIPIGPKGKFQIEISKYEYCGGRRQESLEDYRVFVYTPQMIVCEKLRAICQQMPDYGAIVKRGRPGSARARDFVDICTTVEHFRLDVTSEEVHSLLRPVFNAKRVPIAWLGRVVEYREFHRPDFEAVKATAKPGTDLKEYDYYFDFVAALCDRLKPFWNV